jgi:hypothetical protein
MTRPTHPCDCGQVQIREGEFAVFENGEHTPTACIDIDAALAARRAAFGSYAQRALESGGA